MPEKEDFKKGHLVYLKGDNRKYRVTDVWPGRVKIKPVTGTPKERVSFFTSPANLTREPEFPHQETLPLNWS